MAIINAFLSAIAFWSLPSVHHHSDKSIHRRLKEDVDWVVSRESKDRGAHADSTSGSCNLGVITWYADVRTVQGNFGLPCDWCQRQHYIFGCVVGAPIVISVLDALPGQMGTSCIDSKSSLVRGNFHDRLHQRLLLLGVFERYRVFHYIVVSQSIPRGCFFRSCSQH